MARAIATHRKPQFSLRALLLAVLLAGPMLGWIGSYLRGRYEARDIPQPMSDFGGYGSPSHSRHTAIAGDWPNEGQPSVHWSVTEIEDNAP